MTQKLPTPNLGWRDRLFAVSKTYSTFSSSSAVRTKNVLISFTQLLLEVFLKDITKGSFKNRFPFISFRDNSDTIAYISEIIPTQVSKSNVLLSLGHNYPVDPGAVTSSDGFLFTEVEVELHTFDRLLSLMQISKIKLSLDVLPFNSLDVTIDLINSIHNNRLLKKKNGQLCISIHSDFAVPNIDDRPLTLGLYYGSQSGKELCQKIADGYISYMEKNHPDLRFIYWLRHHSESPRGRLGIISKTVPVSIIAEIDFINRPFKDSEIVQQAFCESILNYNNLLDL